MSRRSDAAELIDLKKRIALAKKNSAKAAGSLDQVMSTLYKKYKCNSIEAAMEKLESMKQRQKEMETKLSKGLKKLREKYDV